MADTPLPDWVRNHAAETPDAPAIVFDGDVMTYGQLDRSADAAAAEWRSGGTGPGGLSVIPGVSHPDTIVALVAGPRAGSTVTVAGSRSLPVMPAPGADAYAVLATSGSGGISRGVILTPANVAAAVQASLRRLGNTAQDRWLLCLPLSHVGGLSVVWRSLSAGGCVVLHPGFEAPAVVASLRSGETSMVSVVPTMLRRMLRAYAGPFSGLSAVLLGGAPSSRELVERALSAGLPVLPTYGMSETCSQVATVAPGEEWHALGTVGRPLDGFAVEIAGAEGPGTMGEGVGEIIVDGPAVSPGYLGEPLRTGPHRTGDLGRFDRDGRLVVVGRLDDVIITGGQNVFPDTVAAAIDTVPGIRQVQVFGMPDPDWGEIVVAAVETDVTGKDLEAAARERLVTYEVPKRWILLDRMPLLPNGKPDRRKLAEIAAGRT